MTKTFIDNFDNEFYTDRIRKNPVIRNHHHKYINDKYAPAWKTLEFATFGSMFQVFKNLKDISLKQEISQQYGIRNVSGLHW